MEDKGKERWLELCERALMEPDSNKFRKLLTEIHALLDESEETLGEMQTDSLSSPPTPS